MGLITASTHGVTPALGTKLPYDTINDFKPVSMIGAAPYVLVLYPGIPAKSVYELVALAKTKPGKLNYGSAGVGSNNHIFGELFKREAGVDIAHIPYKGMGDAITGVFSGSVDMLVVGTAPVVQHIKAGKLIPLAIASSRRSPALPDVPSVVEAGLPKFTVGNWFGLLAPKGTPPDVIEWLHREVVKALATPEVRDRFAGLGVEPSGMSPQELGVLMRDETARWGEVIKAAGIKPE